MKQKTNAQTIIQSPKVLVTAIVLFIAYAWFAIANQKTDFFLALLVVLINILGTIMTSHFLNKRNDTKDDFSGAGGYSEKHILKVFFFMLWFGIFALINQIYVKNAYHGILLFALSGSCTIYVFSIKKLLLANALMGLMSALIMLLLLDYVHHPDLKQSLLLFGAVFFCASGSDIIRDIKNCMRDVGRKKTVINYYNADVSKTLKIATGFLCFGFACFLNLEISKSFVSKSLYVTGIFLYILDCLFFYFCPGYFKDRIVCLNIGIVLIFLSLIVPYVSF